MAGLIISIFSNEGGTGKTTTVVSFGQALVRKGVRNYALENVESSFEIDLFQRAKMLLAAEFSVY
jgi:cellulose biosynthesis protein BcsQ